MQLFWRSAIVALLSWSCPQLRAATASDFTGRWEWTSFNRSLQPITNDVDVVVSGDTISGTFSGRTGQYPISSPSIVGDALNFNILYSGYTATYAIHLTGSVDFGETGGIADFFTANAFTATHNGQTIPQQTTSLPSGVTPVSLVPPITPSPFLISVSTNVPSAVVLNKYVPATLPPLVVGTSSPTTSTIADLGQPVIFNAFVLQLLGSNSIVQVQWQWSKDGVPIAGATTSTLNIASADPSINGRYSCVGTNSDGSYTWSTQLQVRNPPTIVSQSSIIPSKPGGPIHLAVEATTPNGPMLFQWVHDGVDIPGATAGSQLNTTTAVDATSNYDVAVASFANSGKYWCKVTCYGGIATSDVATSTLSPIEIVTQPVGASVLQGASVHLTVEAKALSNWVNFQWYHDGTPISGATNGSTGANTTIAINAPTNVTDATSSFDIPSAQFADAGNYTCRISTSTGNYDTAAARIDVAASAHLVNLSTRVVAGGAAGTPFCGFVVSGTQGLPLLLRAVGPTLAAFGLSGTMAQPTIHLHNPDGSTPVFGGWPAARSAEMTATGAFALQGSLDAATFLTLDHGLYTAEVSDATTNGGGIVLIEVYDTSGATPGNARLINASTRGFVGTGDNAMFTGFVVAGAGTVKLLIRAIGPGLAQFGVGDAITDPQIEVFQGSDKVAENDNWSTRTDGLTADSIQSTSAAVGAFSISVGSKDAVVIRDFPAGAYTAQITGVNSVTGTAIVEVYIVQ